MTDSHLVQTLMSRYGLTDDMLEDWAVLWPNAHVGSKHEIAALILEIRALRAGVLLSKAEAETIYETIDSLSGSNADNVFAWDGTDDPTDPGISAMVKLFRACGKSVPEGL